MSNPEFPQTAARRGPQLVSRDMHPTRMADIANALAAKSDASDDVRVLASIVRELCYQVDRAKSEAMSAGHRARRGF